MNAWIRQRLTDHAEQVGYFACAAGASTRPIGYRLLTYLTAQPDRLITHRQLLKAVWGPAYAEHTHYVRVHMANLRKKLETDPSMPVPGLPRHRRSVAAST